jgi:hypothetical protein
MTCELDVLHVSKRKLLPWEGLQASKVDFEAKTAYVSFDLNYNFF